MKSVSHPNSPESSLVPRVILLARTYPPEIGGVAAYGESVARSLAERGAEVFVLTPRQGGEVKQEAARLQVVPMPVRRNRLLNLIGQLAFFYGFQRKMRIPVVLCGYWIPMGIIAWAASFLTSYRYGVFIYGADLWGYPSRWERWLMKRCFRRAARLLPITRFTAEQLREKWQALGGARGASPSPLERITVVPCTIEPRLLETYRLPEGTDAKATLALQGKQVLLTASTLGWRKGHRFVVEAMGQLVQEFPDLMYVYTGEGPAREAIEEEIRRLGLEKHVRAAGFVDRQTLMKYYQAADLFVMVSYNPDDPADYEGFGIVYLEAAYWGVPSVAARFAGPEEVVEDGLTGVLVDPRDPEQLAEALRGLLRDPQARTRLGAAARAQVLEKYTPRVMAERLYSAFFSSSSGDSAAEDSLS